MRRFIIVLALISLTGSLQSQINFMLQWFPQSQFAGYYVAREKGFYEEAGVDVNIMHPAPSRNALEYLKNGEVDVVSLFLISGISAYSNGTDLVNIGQLSQKSSLLFVAKKESNITDLNDFNQKKIGIWKSGFDELPKVFVQDNNLDIQWVLLTSSVNLFLMGGIDMLTVTYYNEYDQIVNSGVNEDELTRFFLNDYGYDVPEDGLYCTSKTLKTKREELEKFYQASFRGWRYAKEHPEEALEIVLKVMEEEHLPGNYAHQRWMLEKMIELIIPEDKTSYGILSPDNFAHTLEIMISAGFITKEFSYEEFYKPIYPTK